MSPVFVLMEEVLLKKMQNIVGWSDNEGDGIFCPGNTGRFHMSFIIILIIAQTMNI